MRISYPGRKEQRTAEATGPWRPEDRGEERKHRQLLGIPQVLNKCVSLALGEQGGQKDKEGTEERRGRKRV